MSRWWHVKWQRVKLLIIFLLVLGSGALVSLTPGWKAALAQAGKYGYHTSMWFPNNSYSWVNGAGFSSAPVYTNMCFNSRFANEVCSDNLKSFYITYGAGQVLNAVCGDGSKKQFGLRAIAHWQLYWRELNPSGDKTSDIMTSSNCVLEETAKSYCTFSGSTGGPRFHFRTPGPHLDVSCPQ